MKSNLCFYFVISFFFRKMGVVLMNFQESLVLQSDFFILKNFLVSSLKKKEGVFFFEKNACNQKKKVVSVPSSVLKTTITYRFQIFVFSSSFFFSCSLGSHSQFFRSTEVNYLLRKLIWRSPVPPPSPDHTHT